MMTTQANSGRRNQTLDEIIARWPMASIQEALGSLHAAPEVARLAHWDDPKEIILVRFLTEVGREVQQGNENFESHERLRKEARKVLVRHVLRYLFPWQKGVFNEVSETVAQAAMLCVSFFAEDARHSELAPRDRTLLIEFLDHYFSVAICAKKGGNVELGLAENGAPFYRALFHARHRQFLAFNEVYAAIPWLLDALQNPSPEHRRVFKSDLNLEELFNRRLQSRMINDLRIFCAAILGEQRVPDNEGRHADAQLLLRLVNQKLARQAQEYREW